MRERFAEGEQRPTAFDNFRALVRKIDEVHNSPGLSQRRVARREALGIARFILADEDRTRFCDAYNRATVLRPDITSDVYKTLLAARVLKAVELRSVLGIRLHGPIVLPRRDFC